MSPFRGKWWIKLILVVKSLIFTVQHGPTPLTLFLFFFGSTSLKVWGKHKTILKKLTWKHSRLLTGKWEQSKSNVQHWTSNPASVIIHKYKELIHLNTQDWAPVCGSCHVACCIEYSGRDEHHCSTNHVLCRVATYKVCHKGMTYYVWHTMYHHGTNLYLQLHILDMKDNSYVLSSFTKEVKTWESTTSIWIKRHPLPPHLKPHLLKWS